MNTKEILRNIPMFSQLSDEIIAGLETALKAKELADGDILFHQGDPGDELIIIKNGAIEIYEPLGEESREPKPIRVMGKGDLFGEMSSIDKQSRSLSARARGKTTVLVLSGDLFKRLMFGNPDMALSVMLVLIERTRYMTEFLSQVRKWVQKIMDDSDQTALELDASGYEDQTIATLAAEFAQMAARVEMLRKEVAQLRIQIDDKKRKQDVDDIMQSEFYRHLKEKAADIRKKT